MFNIKDESGILICVHTFKKMGTGFRLYKDCHPACKKPSITIEFRKYCIRTNCLSV